MLDEMTAALPADLTERVLHVIGNQRGSDRCIIFISHRLIEIAAVCDRATVLREGATVGVVDINEGSEERIVALMLGERAAKSEAQMAARAGGGPPVEATTPRLAARELAVGGRLHDVSFELRAGEVLGVAALEGQGQDELFDILAGARRPDSGEVLVERRARLVPASGRRHQGRRRVRAGRSGRGAPDAALDPRERRAAVHRRLPIVGPDQRCRRERTKVNAAIAELQIDTRAASEVRQLSGGNQQKVTIARWVAGGVETMLCFDPTRGIDIGTKQQIYELVRDLAAAGAAVLFYTSELKEIQLACDRAIVMFGGRIVAEIPVEEADEPTLLRAAYDLPKDVPMPEELAAEEVAERPRGGRPGAVDRRRPIRPIRDRRCRHERRGGRSRAGAPGRDVEASPVGGAQRLDAGPARAVRRDPAPDLCSSSRTTAPPQLQGLAVGAMPLAMAAVAQAIVVISGGIDLSIGSMMALTSVTAAVLMKDQSEAFAIPVVLGVLLLGLVLGIINGALVVITRVPDIVVTLAMSFVWAGAALWS